MKLAVAALALLPLLPFAITARHVAPPVQVTVEEWTVPWERTRPRDPYPDAKGRIWFVGQVGNYVATFDTATKQFRRWEIDEGTHPHNLIVDRAGMVWYAGNRNGMIGRLDPAMGAITRYPMPDSAVRDPHTLVQDAAGTIWFTAQQSSHVGRLDPKTGEVRLVRVEPRTARPYGIVVAPSGHPWFAPFGASRLVRIDPRTMALTDFPLPDAASRVRRLEVTRDGMVWYADYTRGMLGRLDPKTGATKEWALPGGVRSFPYAMARDHRDRLWMVETGANPNRLVAFDPRTQEWLAPVPIAKSGAMSVRHMVFHAPTREIWFGTDANTIGRARIAD